MPIEINTQVDVQAPRGNNLGNLLLIDAKFFGRPNFSGVPDQFKDSRRKFTVLIPNEHADALRNVGWNVKTDIPTPEDLAEWPDRQTISHMKVMVDDNSDVYFKMGEGQPVQIVTSNFGSVDKTRIQHMDLEIRAWMYNKEEVDAGLEQPKFSARLVAMVAVVQMNAIEERYNLLGMDQS